MSGILPSRIAILARSGIAGIAVLSVFAWAGCAAQAPASRPDAGWASPIARDHALVGRIYDVGARHWVTREALASRLAGADVVLLGEQHDNVDHHRLQASLLEGLAAAGSRPAVAFEQLDLEDQATVDRTLEGQAADAAASQRASALAQAVHWDGRGWPPFDEYRPVFEVALQHGLVIRAANLSRAAMKTGAAAPTAVAAYNPEAWRSVELPAPASAALAADIEDSHCGMATAPMIEAMAKAQRRRDDAMAQVVLSSREIDRSRPRGTTSATSHGPRAVLVCGFGHARRDYGVPLHLVARGRGEGDASVVSVAMLEVLPGLTTPSDYAKALHADGGLPFDYVWFTPRASDDDPCEKFRESLHNMKAL